MPVRPSQRETVLELLEEGPVCGTTLLKAYIPRYAAVVHKLRAEGKTIITKPCTREGHDHESPQIEYQLTGEDAEHSLGSNKKDVPATPPSSEGTGPDANGTLFDHSPSGPNPWLNT